MAHMRRIHDMSMKTSDMTEKLTVIYVLREQHLVFRERGNVPNVKQTDYTLISMPAKNTSMEKSAGKTRADADVNYSVAQTKTLWTQ